jgi:thiamine-monophosphate kinase
LAKVFQLEVSRLTRKENERTRRPKANPEIGERQIIEIMRANLDSMSDAAVPFGDDVSAVNIGAGRVAVLKTDMLVAITDVPRGMSLWQAARKAVVMNVSDFAAKGVKPIAGLVSIGLQKGFTRKDVEEIACGLNAGTKEYGAYIIGGDTNEASDLVIAIMLFGETKRNSLMLRSGARPGDIVAVTGYFGKSAAGLRLLLDGCVASPDLREILLNSVFMPKARLREGLALCKSKGVTASIDSSDGLAWSLHEIARLSSVGLLITSIPTANEVYRFAEFNGLDASGLSLYGGEEYELVVTVKPESWVNAETEVESVGGCLLPIGKVTRDKQVLMNVDGKKQAIQAVGWEHFKRPL